jgi:hypothetical protein
MQFDVRRRRRTVEKHADIFSHEVVRIAQEIAHVCNVVDTASQRRIPVLIYADKQGAVRHDRVFLRKVIVMPIEQPAGAVLGASDRDRQAAR